MARGSAGKTDLTTEVATLFDATLDDGRGTTFQVTNDADSDGDAKVNVSGLHKAGEYFFIAPGGSQPFRLGRNQLATVTACAVTTATIRHGVIAKGW